MRYDSIIVGTGPAGLEAALNLKIRNKSFLLFGPAELSKKVVKAPMIANYLGLPDITGKEMADAFLTHLSKHDIEITPSMISTVYPMGDYFSISSSTADIYEASTVILAPGVHVGSPFKGEEKFLGRGVGYCATCDAPLYKGKNVAIVGYNTEAENEANYVAELADKVYYIPVRSKPERLSDEVQVVEGKVVSIEGDNLVNSLVLDTGELPVDGVFILRESISPATLVPGLETDGNHIKVDSNMRTNVPGCFAAGDSTGKPYQYIRAAGQGLVAAHSAVAYLAEMKI